MAITTIGLDADDTLWHTETHFRLTHERFEQWLAPYSATAGERLAEVEGRNLRLYGYGVKGFILSMLETAMELTDGGDATPLVREILAAGRELLAFPIEPLPGVEEALAALSERYRLVLITKGDLLDQERKLAQSGLGELFDGVEIVSDKSVDTYRRVFTRHGDGAQRAMMIGNSLKSDVLPALSAGAWGVFVPHELTWAAEHADEPANHPRFRKIERLGQLTDVIAEIEAS